MSVQQRRKYDPEFKRNAVQLTEEPGRTVAEVAENLGITKDNLYRWRRQQRTNGHRAFPGSGREALTEPQKRIRELEKKLKDAEMERDILKKPWPSSPGYRNEISIYPEQPLLISGEEDVPFIESFSERILSLAEKTILCPPRRK